MRRRFDPEAREILRLAVPAFFALIAEPLFLISDSAIVGHLGTDQLAGLALAGAALATVVSLSVFLAYGTTAAVSRQLGAGDVGAALRQGIDGLWLALCIGALGTALLEPWVHEIVRGLGGEGATAGYAETYLRIGLLGLPSMLLVLAATGVLRGLQDTRTPLVVATAMALANIALNVWLVYGVGLGIAGSAWGTVIAQTAGAIALAAVVVRGARRSGAALRPGLAGIWSSARSGTPLLIRTLTLRIALLVATYVASRQGSVPLAAHQIVFTLWTFLAFALDAVAIAGQALTGLRLGAGDVAGVRSTVRRMMRWGWWLGLLGGLLLVAGLPLYGPVFTPDGDVREQLLPVILVAALLQPACGLVFVLDGVLIGAGDGRYLAWAGVFTLVVFLPLAGVVLATSAGLVALWWAFGAFMLARLATLVWRERGNAWLVTGAGLSRGGLAS